MIGLLPSDLMVTAHGTDTVDCTVTMTDRRTYGKMVTVHGIDTTASIGTMTDLR